MARGVKKGTLHASDSTKLQIVLAMTESGDEIKKLIPRIDKAKFINIGDESAFIWATHLGDISLLVNCADTDDWKTWEITTVKW